MNVEEIEREVRAIKADLQMRSAVRTVNTKWVVAVGVFVLAAIGYTNLYTIPSEAKRAAIAEAKTQIGPEVLQKRDELISSLQSSKQEADQVVAQIVAASRVQFGTKVFTQQSAI